MIETGEYGLKVAANCFHKLLSQAVSKPVVAAPYGGLVEFGWLNGNGQPQNPVKSGN